MTAPFASVLGHEYAREGLWRSRSEGRLHHALLFHGLQGVGKRTLAFVVARTLLCASPRLGPCETCTHCQRTAIDVHPDLIIVGREDIQGIDPDTLSHRQFRIEKKKEPVGKTIDVEYMRRLGDWLLEKPFEAAKRVLVVIDAERMNIPAANVFLKSLEEPAAGNVAILTSSSPSFLRPTVRSRCASIQLSGVPQRLIEERLMQVGIDPREARFRAQASAGSLSRALQTRPRLDELRDLLLRRFGGGKDAEVAAFLASSYAADKDVDRDAALHLFATLLRDVAVLKSGGPAEGLVHGDVGDRVAQAAAGSLDPFALFSKVVEARERVAGNANRTSLWDDLLHAAGSGARV